MLESETRWSEEWSRSEWKCYVKSFRGKVSDDLLEFALRTGPHYDYEEHRYDPREILKVLFP
ncbi:hypothetical protein HYT56_05165 [Candidatus Woesearchaeota archaeon]|nr:hypothetical protein [Candidatus Woesearchaeota archaeon]